MPSVPEVALAYAQSHGLDLNLTRDLIPTSPFQFNCLEPSRAMLEALRLARSRGDQWPERMPVPVVTYSVRTKLWRIMDGMQRICAAKLEGFDQVPALIASGETYDALERILADGYYGEDFVEMLAMVSPMVESNLKLRDSSRLAGAGRR